MADVAYPPDWILNALDDPTYIEDTQGLLVHCNQALLSLLEAEPTRIAGHPVSQLTIPPGYRATRRQVSSPEGLSFTWVTLRRDLPSIEALERRAKELEANERKLAELLSRQRTAQQAQRLESVGQLTGGIAHDFNNLLAVITGCLELLKVRAHGNAPVTDLADRALTAAERGAALIQRLLAFSRRQMLSPEPTNVNTLMLEVLDLSRRSLAEHIEIVTDLCDEPWQVLVDPSQLENAILNLVINARDAMPEGGILMVSTAKVHLDTADDGLTEGDYLRVTVSDTGTGIGVEHVGRVFEPFYTTKETGRGSGLGLSMVYGFVTQSHGTVRIESKPNLGTSVHLFLPRASAARLVEPRVLGEQPLGRREVVLVVEDDNAVRSTVVSVLEELDYRVISAPTAAEALEILEFNASIDLLLTDVVLGGTASGPELAQRAREARAGLRVAFMTGYADQHLSQLGRDARVLKKPFRAPELARFLRSALEGT